MYLIGNHIADAMYIIMSVTWILKFTDVKINLESTSHIVGINYYNIIKASTWGKYLAKCMNQTTLSGISKTNLGLALTNYRCKL